MPRVPDWQAPQTRTGVLPVPDLHAQAVPFQQDGLGNGLIKAGRVTQHYQQQLQDQADFPLLLDAENQLKTLQQRLTFDETEGFITQRGQVALRRQSGLSLESEYLSKFEKEAGAIVDTLPLPRQKAKLQAVLQKQRSALQNALIKHTGQQADVFYQDVLESSIATRQRDMALNATNPEALAENSLQIVAATYELGKRQGLSAEHTALAIRENLSPGHKAALTEQVNAGRLDVAKAYLAQIGEQLTEADLSFAHNLIGEAERVQAADALSQRFWRSGLATPEARYAAALSAAGQIQDRELQKQVKARIEGFKDVEDAQQKALFENAAAGVKQAGFAALVPVQLARLSAAQQEKLWRLNDLYHKGATIKTDYKLFAQLLSLTPEQLAKTSPDEVRTFTNNADFNHYMEAWRKANSGDGSGLNQLKAEQALKIQYMKLASIKTGDNQEANKKDNLKEQQQFDAAYQLRLADFKAKNHREPDLSEKESLFRSLLLNVVVPGGGTLPFGMGQFVPFATGDVQELWKVPPEQWDNSYLDDGDLEEVPVLERAAIIQVLRAQGIAPTKEAIAAEYLNRLNNQWLTTKDRPRDALFPNEAKGDE